MATKKSKQEEALQLLDDLDSFAPPAGDDTSIKPTSGGARTNRGSSNNNNASGTGGASGSGEPGEAAEVLAFLDEITQKSAEPTRPTTVHISRSATPTLRKSTERVRLGGGPSASSSTSSLHRTLSTGPDGNTPSPGGTRVRIEGSPPMAGAPSQGAASASSASGGGWGWGSVWSTASAALQQAKSAVDEQVKHLPRNEQARKWGEGVIEYAKTAQLDKLGRFSMRHGKS